MSIRLISRVYEKKFDRPAQSIMVCLADHAHDDGSHVFPSIPRIAWKTDYSERQVQRIMRRLIDCKVLILTRPATANRANEYRIDLSAVPDKPPFRPAPNDYNTDALTKPEGGDILTPLTNNVTPPPSKCHPTGDTDVTLTVIKPSDKPLDGANAQSPLTADAYRNHVLETLSKGQGENDNLTNALQTLTGRTIDPRNKTAAGYIQQLREWGATPDKCRHFAHYAQVVINAPRKEGEDGWRGKHWKPTLKEVWELWATAMEWKPTASKAQRQTVAIR